MKFTKSLAVAAVAGLFVAGNVQADAFPPKDLDNFFGNVAFAGTNGVDLITLNDNEVIMPRLTGIDANSDGYPEKIEIAYFVYKVSDGSLIRRAAPWTFDTPAIPAGCSPNDPNKWFEFDLNFRAARRDAGFSKDGTTWNPEGRRMHTAVNMDINCWTGTTDAFTTGSIVYSANINGVETPTNPLASWIRKYPGATIIGLNGVDTDGDLVTDTLMITAVADTTGGTNHMQALNAAVDLVSPQTGSIIKRIGTALLR